VRLALVTFDYPPLRTSASVQMRDLAQEIKRQGHEPVLIVPTTDLGQPWRHEVLDGIEILRLDVIATRGLGFFRRAIGELLFPFSMLASFRGSPHENTRWDGIVWYSPTIFLGWFVRKLKRRSGCRAYLILRDVFPEWAADLGILRKGPIYWLFKAVAALQYSVADVIGIQSPSNGAYLKGWEKPGRRTIEVLQNWVAPATDVGCSIRVETTPLRGRRIFVYAGNMGVAQGMDVLLDLAGMLLSRPDLGFLFVGRGSEYERLRHAAADRGLTNVVFGSEIDPTEIPGLFAQCHVGLLVLDPRHRSHNIPGKFLTYMQAGLPVLARVNAGTDLIGLITKAEVGFAYAGDSIQELAALAVRLVDDAGFCAAAAARGRELGTQIFSPSAAARQVCAGLAYANKQGTDL
jgi:glycosyltransferase involved in cell wall biosynthesis